MRGRPAHMTGHLIGEVIMADQTTTNRGGSTPDRSPNDDRSDAKNPTSSAYEADQANQEKQRQTKS